MNRSAKGLSPPSRWPAVVFYPWLTSTNAAIIFVLTLDRASKKKDEVDFKLVLDNLVLDLVATVFEPTLPAVELLLFQLVSHLVLGPPPPSFIWSIIIVLWEEYYYVIFSLILITFQLKILRDKASDQALRVIAIDHLGTVATVLIQVWSHRPVLF